MRINLMSRAAAILGKQDNYTLFVVGKVAPMTITGFLAAFYGIFFLSPRAHLIGRGAS